MKLWNVDLPLTGRLYCQIEAETAEEAVEQALGLDFNLKIAHTAESTAAALDLAEFETHRQVVQGNVFYGSFNEATAELDSEVEDEGAAAPDAG